MTGPRRICGASVGEWVEAAVLLVVTVVCGAFVLGCWEAGVEAGFWIGSR